MTVVCLAGPSAAGKTTAARELAARGAVRVPEVAALFEPPEPEPPEWYVDRQCDRWARAVAAEEDGALAVLDGDPFQALWYNWVAGAVGGWEASLPRAPDVARVAAQYREHVLAGDVAFPDAYVLLSPSREQLRARQRSDGERERRNFEYHLRFVEPQRRYFEALAARTPVPVSVVDGTTERVVSVAESTVDAVDHSDRDDAAVLDAMVAWLDGADP